MTFRSQLKKFNLIRFLSSVKLNVVCLTLLYILTFWGTLDQVQNGLYQAQNRFFESFVFLAFGFLPFPGAQLVMWVLFINLLCVALTRFIYSIRNIGIIIIHSGLLLFLISGYLTLHGAKESFVHLKEGEASNLSVAYHDWEISIWKQNPNEDPLLTDRAVTAVELNRIKSGQTISIKNLGFDLFIKELYRNSTVEANGNAQLLNASGYNQLIGVDLEKDPQKNSPGIIFQIQSKDQERYDVLLYSNDRKPLSVTVNKVPYELSLRLKRRPLPFTLKLIDFKKEDHPGTDTARTFQSRVEIQMDKAHREKLISMNDPLRYTDFTFYQSSFAVDKSGEESSVLAVVENKGRLMPYISTFVTVLGLAIHFIMAGLRYRKNPRKRNS